MKIAVDASALLAILLGEPDSELYVSKILTAAKVWISPLSWWEVQVVIGKRRGAAAEVKSSAWMESLGIQIEPVTADQSRIAAVAFAKYHGRPARLNMGDCFAYALARSKNAPLLYKGKDFDQTDVESA